MALPSREKALRLKDRLRAGDLVVGQMISEFWTRGIGRIVEASGYDFVLLDMEHSGATMSDVADQAAWLRGTSLTTLVRPPSERYEYIARAFDCGIDGIMVPRVQTVAAAENAVHAALYPPQGGRGLALGAAHDDFTPRAVTDTVKDSNAAAIVAIQIETRAALEAVDEIATIPGVTIAWFGPHDYALECGLLGQGADVGVIEAAKVVADACARARITAAVQLSNLSEGPTYYELGYRCISVGKDAALFGAAARQALEGVRALNTGRSMDGRG